MTPPPITDIARWIAGDAAAAYRSVLWCLEAIPHAHTDAEYHGWWRAHWYALGHLHAIEATTGRTVPR